MLRRGHPCVAPALSTAAAAAAAAAAADPARASVAAAVVVIAPIQPAIGRSGTRVPLPGSSIGVIVLVRFPVILQVCV